MIKPRRIYGIGFPRTGSNTLRTALKKLGFIPRGPKKNPNPDVEIFVGDWMLLPNNKFKQIDEDYPEAQFILTVRKDALTWYESVLRRTEKVGKHPGVLRQRLSMYGSSVPLKPLYIQRYCRHNEEVETYFLSRYGKDKDKKLLRICFEDNDSDTNWRLLSEFLDCDSPYIPFPHVNKSKQWKSNS